MNLAQAAKFLRADIWRVKESDLPRPKSLVIRLLRIFLLTLRGLTKGRTQLRASALTYYSLLAVVPAFALVFGIAKGFGLEKAMEKLFLERLEGQEEVVVWVLGLVHTLLENVKGGLIASIGLVLLFWAVFMVLSHMESAFNDIWGVKRSRSLGQKISDYLALVLIVPFLFILSSAMTVVITSSVTLIVQKITPLGLISPLIFLMLKLLPFCVLWLLFTFLYAFMPNTKISFRSAVLAGIIAGTIYQVFQGTYIHFQFLVSRYNAVYGSFAALPLFFIWLDLSWLIVLFGAEISFAHQNVDTYEFEHDCLTVSHSFKKLLSLRIVHLLVRHFVDGQSDLDAGTISRRLEIPIMLVNQIAFDLVEAGVISEVKVSDDSNPVYQPARDSEILTIKYVLDALDRHGCDDIPVAQSEELRDLAASLAEFGGLVEKSPANKRLKDV